MSDQLERGEWEPVPKVVLALTAQVSPKISREEAAKRLKEIGALSTLTLKKEDTAWYQRIISREKSGDKNLTPLQIRFAHEAAELHGFRG